MDDSFTDVSGFAGATHVVGHEQKLKVPKIVQKDEDRKQRCPGRLKKYEEITEVGSSSSRHPKNLNYGDSQTESRLRSRPISKRTRIFK